MTGFSDDDDGGGVGLVGGFSVSERVGNNVMREGKVMFNYVQCMTIRDFFLHSFIRSLFSFLIKKRICFI